MVEFIFVSIEDIRETNYVDRLWWALIVDYKQTELGLHNLIGGWRMNAFVVKEDV